MRRLPPVFTGKPGFVGSLRGQGYRLRRFKAKDFWGRGGQAP
ncbi:MAG: hypothetical protein P8O10_02475 [Pseudorhodobacter sp.]|nr:hypothetical protein [Pseudorhodobacter sp.]